MHLLLLDCVLNGTCFYFLLCFGVFDFSIKALTFHIDIKTYEDVEKMSRFVSRGYKTRGASPNMEISPCLDRFYVRLLHK